jgi:hypothetical protein
MGSSRFLLTLASLFGLAATTFACGSSNDASTGCSGLSACCASLSGGEAATCQATINTDGVTDAECTQALNSLESAGYCGSTGGSGTGGGDTASTDGGGFASDDAASPFEMGCAALSTCCPTLPVAGDPMGCLTVAMEGTAEACAESLATYQSEGYCQATGIPTPGLHCLLTMGSLTACFTLSMNAGSCPQGTAVSACPTANLSGCCRDIPSGSESLSYCEYGAPSSSLSALESACADSKGIWSN